MDSACSMHGKADNSYILVDKYERKSVLET